MQKNTSTVMMNTSPERVDALINLSDAIYPIINAEIDGQIRARRMLRLGMAATADALHTGTARYAGNQLHHLLRGELQAGGLPIDDSAYDPFPLYRSSHEGYPSPQLAFRTDPFLDALAIRYADVERATILIDKSPETDATHAIHLANLALPYAAQHYPQLEQEKIALYCLLHDIVEAYVGDTPSLGISNEAMQRKQLAEMRALDQLKHEAGAEHPQLVQLVFDYEHLCDEESRFVKSFDKLDPGFTQLYSNGWQLIHRHGITHADHYLSITDQTTRRMWEYASDFPDLLRDREELLLRIAEQTDWPK